MQHLGRAIAYVKSSWILWVGNWRRAGRSLGPRCKCHSGAQFCGSSKTMKRCQPFSNRSWVVWPHVCKPSDSDSFSFPAEITSVCYSSCPSSPFGIPHSGYISPEAVVNPLSHFSVLSNLADSLYHAPSSRARRALLLLNSPHFLLSTSSFLLIRTTYIILYHF